MECKEIRCLDDILKLNLPMLDGIKEKFHKRVYFDYNGSCKIGILCGICKKSSDYFYIIKSNEEEIYVSCLNSLTTLCV